MADVKWHAEVDEEGNSNNCFDPITPFIMVCAEQQSTNHANPSLRSGAGVKGQANVRIICCAQARKGIRKQLVSLLLAMYGNLVKVLRETKI